MTDPTHFPWQFWIDRGGTFTDIVARRSGGHGGVVRAVHVAGPEKALRGACGDGIRACAIVLVHGYRYPAHEARLAELARAIGFIQVSVSHEVSPLMKLVSRGDTTVVDAYLSPILRRYVAQVEADLPGVGLQFLQSSVGLTDSHRL